MDDNLKRCGSCNEYKPLSAYHGDSRSSDGKRCYCKDCVSDYHDQRDKSECKAQSDAWAKENKRRLECNEIEIPSVKVCLGCNEEKPIEKFGGNVRRKDGHNPKCKDCTAEWSRSYVKDLRQKYKEYWLAHEPDRSGTKKCSGCKTSKSRTQFGINRTLKDGLKADCYDCEKIRQKKYAQQNKQKWHSSTEDRFAGNKKCNVCKETKSKVQFGTDSTMKDGVNRTCEDCRKKQVKERLKTDPVFKLRCRVSSAIRNALVKNNGSKYGKSVWKHLPYNPQQLREHLEKQFEPWMSWDNHGIATIEKRTWQIDHIIPCTLLQYDSMDHPNFQKCWALKNLRPLDAFENIAKGNLLLEEYEDLYATLS